MAAGRPLALVVNVAYNSDRCIQYFNVICVNRYFGWYDQIGRMD